MRKPTISSGWLNHTAIGHTQSKADNKVTSDVSISPSKSNTSERVRIPDSQSPDNKLLTCLRDPGSYNWQSADIPVKKRCTWETSKGRFDLFICHSHFVLVVPIISKRVNFKIWYRLRASEENHKIYIFQFMKFEFEGCNCKVIMIMRLGRIDHGSFDLI